METSVEIATEDLPLWMRQARRGVDWGVLCSMMFSLLAAWSFLTQPNLPRTNATENYVFRTADYAAAMQEGRLYPRWSPHTLIGYGAPIPNYYPPGAPYLAALIQVLLTDDSVSAVRIAYALALFAAGTATYVFVTRWAGAAAGVLASVLYVYSPFVGLVAPQILGDLPGVIGLALLPLFLWAVSRLLQLNRAPDLLLSAAVIAALLLTDLRMAAVGTAFAILLMGWHTLSQSRRWSPWFFAAIGLGVGLAAMYWLPALLEHNLVQWRAPLDNGLPLRLSWSGLFAPTHQLDLAELAPIPQLTLGIVNVIFAACGLLGTAAAWWSGQVKSGIQVQFGYLSVGILLIAAAVLWFPGEFWLLGPVMLCLSIGGSAALRLYDLVPARRLYIWKHLVESRSKGNIVLKRLLMLAIHPRAWQRLLLPISLVIVLVGALPVWISTPSAGTFGNVDANAEIAYEQQGYGIAVLPPNLALPLTISDSLAPNRFLIAGYQSNNLNKIPIDEMSAEVRASVLSHASHDYRFQLQVSRFTTLDILTAFFPGWEATLDGKPLVLVPNDKNGLMQVSLPASQNGILDISLNATPTRLAAWVLTWTALAILALLTIWRFRQHHSHYDDLDLLKSSDARLVGLVLACFTVVMVQAVLPGNAAQLRAHPGYTLDNSLSIESRTSAGLETLSYRINTNQVGIGETLDLTLYWSTLRFLTDNYQVQVFLRDTTHGIPWLRTDFRYPGGYPTRRWLVDHYVTDPYHIYVPSSILPGEYQIAIEVYACNPTCSADDRLLFFSSTGDPLGQTLILPVPITIHP